jgi:hypothetical protein
MFHEKISRCRYNPEKESCFEEEIIAKRPFPN